MTNGQLSQAPPPDKANELFEKLLATSNNAVKTRERLFADLKEELQLLANLQEEHLFPVLRRHGMHDLLREASNDNAETVALLTELERMPKDSDAFIGQVAELRRVFQQHIRDDKKQLLPAVLKVLSDEEANAIAETVEDEMASIDESRRSEARRARGQDESVQRVTEDVAVMLRAGVEGAQTMAQVLQETVGNSFSALMEVTRHSAGQSLHIADRPDGAALGLSEQAVQNLQAVAESGTALARGLQEVSRELVDRSQRRLQRNLDGLQTLARCRTLADLVEAQSALLRDNLEQTFENSRRIAELTIQTAEDAGRTVKVQAEKSAERIRRVA